MIITYIKNIIKSNYFYIDHSEMAEKLKLNSQIQEKEVLLIDDKGVSHGVIPIEKAMEIAKAQSKDLVEVSTRSENVPSVCKILDYGKMKFRSSQKDRVQKKKQSFIKIKAMKLSARIEGNDIKNKLSKVIGWIKKGYKVRIYCLLKGPDIHLKNEAINIIEEFVADAGADFESKISLAGRMLSCTIVPSK